MIGSIHKWEESLLYTQSSPGLCGHSNRAHSSMASSSATEITTLRLKQPLHIYSVVAISSTMGLRHIL